MKKLLEFLVKSIVDSPQDVSVEEKEEGDELILDLKVNPNDVKIVIGKEGKTIRSLREIIKIKAIKEKKRVRINVS
jgi:predicted RNA-binding protein YlqC (UPF0109 family)